MEDVDVAAAHESRELDEVLERLIQRFPDIPEERVRAAIDEAHERFVGNPIRNFVPVFVERSVRDVLSGSVPAEPDSG